MCRFTAAVNTKLRETRQWELYRTGSGYNCVREGNFIPGESVSMAPRQVVTLYHRPVSALNSRRQAPARARFDRAAGARAYGLDGRLMDAGSHHGPGVALRASAGALARDVLNMKNTER